MGPGLRIGASVAATDRTWRIDELAAAAEERGIASLMVPEHTHLPIEHSEHPAGTDLPDDYARMLDPFLALGAAAATTSHLELVTGVALLAQRDPIVTAKEVATLDLLSGGRVTLGVGYGWNVVEVEHHGVAFAHRREVVRDRLALMRALWTQEVASLEAEHARLAPSRMWPKPVQRPHPPVLLGANLGPRTLADLVAVCDGWLPQGARATARGLPRLRDAWDDAGRDGEPQVHVTSARADVGYLRRLAELGIGQASVWLPSAGRDVTIAALDRLATVVEELG